MGRLSPSLSTRLVNGLYSPSSNPFWVFTIALPTAAGTVSLRYASASINSPTGGQYPGKVLEWGDITQSAIDTSGRIERNETTVTVDDTDRSIAKILAGPYANNLRGALAGIFLGEPNVASQSWYTAFFGMIASWDVPAPLRVRFKLTPADQQMRAQTPLRKFLKADWNNLPLTTTSEVVNTTVPLAYGKHNSQGLGDQGMVPCPYVDTTTHTYAVCLGRAKSVDRVYVDGVITVSGWTAGTTVKNGVIYTTITFTTDQGTKKITADVQGYENIGSGAGTMLDNPADCIKHYLTNFVFSNYANGNWLSTSAKVDSVSFANAALFCAQQGYKTSFYVGESTTPEELLSSWAYSFGLIPYWTNAGQIGLAVDSHKTTSIYMDWPYFRHDLHDFGGGFTLTREEQDIRDRYAISFQKRASDGTYVSSVVVKDPDTNENASEDISLDGSPSYSV